MKIKKLLKSTALLAHRPLRPFLHAVGIDAKRLYEISYWRMQYRNEGELKNEWYESIFTNWFDISRAFYKDKRILDIGCGPRGSLEWATDARERVGLDPLVEDYRRLGIDRHAMSYVNAPAEQIPFAADHFDVVSSINSLDHVDDVEAVIREIIRVLKPGGLFLLAVEIHPTPTIAEPQALAWDFLKKFTPAMRVMAEHHFEAAEGMGALVERRPFDHADVRPRSGWLQAQLLKVEHDRAGLATD